MMLRFVWLLGIVVHAFATQVPVNNPEWSWQTEDAISTSESKNQGTGQTQDKRAILDANGNIEIIDPPTEQRSVESVVDEILVSNRQGRNIEGFDQLYADPEVKNALQLGNETIARTYIRDKLCSLGLMNCENVEGRRPYYSPHRGIYPQDIIYAQPVTIKPVGRPLPAIPVKRPYSPATRPGPPPSSSFVSSGPPPEVIYGVGGAPHPPSFGPSPSLIGSYPAFKKPGLSSFSSKPVYEAGSLNEGFDFESNGQFIDKKQIALRPSIGSDAVQQHVHHHYHHSDGAAGATIAGGPTFGANPISQGAASLSYGSSYGNIGTTYDIPNSGVLGGSFQDLDDYKKAFKVKGSSNDANVFGSSSASSYADKYPIYEKPTRDFTYGKAEGYKPGKYFTATNYVSSNAVHSSSNDYIAAGSTNSFNYGNSNGNDFRNDFSAGYSGDCVCVPYDQCPSEHAGRKDDLFLPIDPRNLNKNIEAEATATAEKNANETSAIVQIAKNGEVDSNAFHQISAEEEQPKQAQENVRNKREAPSDESIEGRKKSSGEGRQYLNIGSSRACGPGYVCCSQRQPSRKPRPGQCGVRYTQGINGRIKTPSYVDGDSEFGEYPWQVAILKKDPTESVYVCGGTLVSPRHILTAAHCVKTYAARDLRVRLGEWDVNHDVEFYPYIERDVANVHVHPEFYAGTLYNDIAILRIDHDVDFQKNPHISPACLPDKRDDFTRSRCWTTGWGKDAFGDFGKYQNILKEVDVPVVSNPVCEQQMRRTRLGPSFNLHSGFICAGGEEGKDACKGDGGGPMVCERNGRWQLAGIVSWGIGCGQPGVPGVYARVSYYLDWIQQIINRY
uniref:uncharacterized protein LOC117155243 isoform X1 n=1 Tax=Bombus vancouverensis nearcticus TaxID=2705178 RepID=UPI00143C8CB1|nr:uncharacterized protein LOC117155243 isoform X1 [Bombus vancouverensis nearcticus]XP_033186920.1 uncharacterized protein LOC117155243 isoform X1 [Bombus vancouverensis nearcticus]